MAPFRNTDFSKDILLKRYAAAKLPAPLAPGTQGGDIQPTTAPGTELMPIQKPITQLNPMASRYAKNPYPGQERAMEKILDHSGYAKPMVAFMMARAGKKGAEFANNQATALAEAEQKKAALENEYKMIDYAFKVLDKNPNLYNKIMQIEARRPDAHPLIKLAAENPAIKETAGDGLMVLHTKDGRIIAADKKAVLNAIINNTDPAELFKTVARAPVDTGKPENTKTDYEKDANEDFKTALKLGVSDSAFTINPVTGEPTTPKEKSSTILKMYDIVSNARSPQPQGFKNLPNATTAVTGDMPWGWEKLPDGKYKVGYSDGSEMVMDEPTFKTFMQKNKSTPVSGASSYIKKSLGQQ